MFHDLQFIEDSCCIQLIKTLTYTKFWNLLPSKTTMWGGGTDGAHSGYPCRTGMGTLDQLEMIHISNNALSVFSH